MLHIAHRAMADVRAMKDIFTLSSLAPLLNKLTLRNRSEVHETWSSKNNDRMISQQLIGRMGKDCTKKMAIRLYENGINYDHLRQGFQNCSLEQKFDKWLQDAVIRLKNWRNRLHHHFSSTVLSSR